MTPKTKVLKILDKYRDMSLTMGCEVRFDHFASQYDDGEGDWENIRAVIVGDGFYGELEVITTDLINDDWKNIRLEVEREKVTILGHPATLATLLKGMDKILNYDISQMGNEIRVQFVQTPDQDYVEDVFIPLVTTLQEIPAPDPMWEACVNIFGL